VAVMRAVGYHPLPPHARVRMTEAQYIVELDVADFTVDELTIEALGPVVAVRGEQLETEADEGLPFRIQERLEETFRLPDDVELATLAATYHHGVLEIRVDHAPLVLRHVPIEPHPGPLLNPDAAPV
jgi:HSP20 family molecular chaperone IbpA